MSQAVKAYTVGHLVTYAVYAFQVRPGVCVVHGGQLDQVHLAACDVLGQRRDVFVAIAEAEALERFQVCQFLRIREGCVLVTVRCRSPLSEVFTHGVDRFLDPRDVVVLAYHKADHYLPEFLVEHDDFLSCCL